MFQSMPTTQTIDVDIAIIGGGIAGLWVMNVVRAAGFSALLFEANAVGGIQTTASQGILHGGVKYALGARLTRASEAIADMPDRWRSCLRGESDVDLSAVTPRANDFFMFADTDTRSRIAGFFASRTMRGRVASIDRQEFPPAFEGFEGVLYRLQDFVVDVPALTRALVEPHRTAMYHNKIAASQILIDRADHVVGLRLGNFDLRASRTVFAAGAGNSQLLKAVHHAPPMQRRPLHQVVVRHANLPQLFAHCLTRITRSEPRLTITTHRTNGDNLWYIGGQIATDGIGKSPELQIEHARDELNECVPWIDWRGAEINTLMIDRAEPKQTNQQRPDEAFVGKVPGGLVCWPTKLTLAPDLGDKVVHALREAGITPTHQQPIIDMQPPPAARAPW